MWTDAFHTVGFHEKEKMLFFSFYLAHSKKCHFQVFFALKQVFFPSASPPDEALHVFALFLAAGVAASRRRAGRARRHRPVCWLELTTRQMHEDAPRSAQPAAALGTRPAGPHHEPPQAPTGHQLAAPGLVATSDQPLTHEELATTSPRSPVILLLSASPSSRSSRSCSLRRPRQ